MGRVAKYKKIKSFDPFSKQNKRKNKPSTPANDSRWLYHGAETADDLRSRKKKRSKTATLMKQRQLDRRSKKGKRKVDDFGDGDAFDLPPEGDDFDLSDIVGSVKKEKKRRLDEGLVDEEEVGKNGSAKGAAAKSSFMGESLEDEKRTARLLKIDPKTGKSKSSSLEKSGKMEGESFTAFKKRVNEDVKQILIKEKANDRGNVKVNPEKRERQKEFLKNKKKRKKRGNKKVEEDYEDDDNEVLLGGGDNKVADSFVTGERAVAKMAAAASSSTSARNASSVALNDQVERPPIFNLLPRGADKLSKKKKAKSLDYEAEEEGGGEGGVGKKRKTMDENQIAAEQNAMEIMRRKVQAQYALVKAQRKKAGDFHL